jgi:Eco47II restriction endonuclease
MNNYNLSFISDEDLYNHVKNTVEKYRFKSDLAAFNKNIIDPIKMTFDSKVYAQGIENTVQNEVLRQVDKTNTNLIGYFHQNIFNFIGSDWIVPKNGFDIENEKRKIYVEMKNKHNTMNSSSSQKTYINMLDKLIKDKDNICLLVEVIAKTSQDKVWVTSINSKNTKHVNIRKVSIDKFYETVTGDENAFKKLCEVLPSVIDDVMISFDSKESVNTVFSELKEYSENILESLYLVSFKNYNGFDDFKIDH